MFEEGVHAVLRLLDQRLVNDDEGKLAPPERRQPFPTASDGFNGQAKLFRQHGGAILRSGDGGNHQNALRHGSGSYVTLLVIKASECLPGEIKAASHQQACDGFAQAILLELAIERRLSYAQQLRGSELVSLELPKRI